jgi:hypothetical protein
MPEDTAPVVYQFRVTGVSISEETIANYYYSASEEVANLDSLVEPFFTTVITPQLSIMNGNAFYTRLDIVTVKGGIAFASFDFLHIGTVSGDCLPPNVSYDFTLLRAGVGERNGYKRIAGVSESSQQQGTVTSGILALCALVSAGLSANLEVGEDAYPPCIRRTKIHRVPQNPPKFYTMSGATYSKIGTQNSRKFGHGR